MQPVTIENELLRMDVWPQIGGKVSSLIDKADQYDLLFNYPAELPTVSQYDVDYVKGWYAGWDECFPAVSPSRYAGHPYDGIAVPDHGELWGLPTTAVPTRDGITTVWHGLRFGYRLTRKLYLEGPSIIAHYSLVNLAPFEFRFVWAMHPLLSMTAPVEIRLPEASSFRWSHDAAGKDVQQPFTWPTLADGINLSRLNELPSEKAWKVYALDPIASPAIIRYPARRRQVTMEYSSEDELPAYWALWVNTGGWSHHRHFSIEPTTGRFDQIDRATKDRSAGTVGPLARRDWEVRWTVAALET